MTTWHDRLQLALAKRGKDWPDLVAVSGCSKPSVYAWKPTANKRSTMMDGDNAALVCEFLQINQLWLFHGRGPSGLEDREYETPAVTSSPLKLAAEPNPPTYPMSPDEQALLNGYRSASDETRGILLLIAEGAIVNFSMRRRGTVARPRLRLVKG